jgi:hypothetical protein
MDLKKYDTVTACDAGAEMELKDPVTGEGLDAFITLAGVDSKAFRKAQDDCANARIRNQANTFGIKDIRKENVFSLAACTLGWRGIEEDGAAIPFSKQAVIDLYTSYPWIFEQVNAFIGNRANYLRD